MGYLMNILFGKLINYIIMYFDDLNYFIIIQLLIYGERYRDIQRYRDTEIQRYRDAEMQRYRDTEI
jgi:hypothetical protein